MTSHITVRTLQARQPYPNFSTQVEVEVTSDLLDDQLLDDLLAFAIDTVGARVLDVRVLDRRPPPAWHGPSG